MSATACSPEELTGGLDGASQTNWLLLVKNVDMEDDVDEMLCLAAPWRPLSRWHRGHPKPTIESKNFITLINYVGLHRSRRQQRADLGDRLHAHVEVSTWTV